MMPSPRKKSSIKEGSTVSKTNSQIENIQLLIEKNSSLLAAQEKKAKRASSNTVFRRPQQVI
jgi:hypothetical protein|tara:strand:+ start:238 stop:423 length:186 start_codon:yes stop_codon:yes gene_type:complete